MTMTKKIEIKPIGTGQADFQFDLTLYDRSKVLLVNMIPRELSDETGQDSGPFLAVHPDCQLMVGAAFNFPGDASSSSSLYLSTDGGWTWVRQSKIPANPVSNQTYCFSGRGKKLYGVIQGGLSKDDFGMISVLATDDPTSDVPMRFISKLGSKGKVDADEPFIQAHAFIQDRIYVGQNYFGPELGGGKTAAVRVSTDGGKKFRLLGLEARSTGGQDAPSVRPSIAKDGTVYVAFIRWASGNIGKFKGDVIVTRDDKGAIGRTPFRSLIDPVDGKPGRIVAQDRVFPFGSSLGKQRIGSSLSLAVDPNNSATVYVAWADLDPSHKSYTIHLRKSVDRGLNWSKDLLTIPSATNPAIAVSDQGTVGFLYQQFLGPSKREKRWETHFQSSPNGLTGWINVTLATFPTVKEPKLQFDPYLGDKIHLISVANNFYGIFSAPNIPERKYFPQGVHFQRRYKKGKLLSSDGKTNVAISIDPYFFRISREHAGAVSTTVDRLLAEIRGPALANYTGFVTAIFLNKEGRPTQEIGLGQECHLKVQFSQKRPKESRAEPIEIRGGEDAAQVPFRIAVDSGDFEVRPERKTVSIPARGAVEVPFEAVAPKVAGEHTLFIQVFQLTRLVQVVAAKLSVRDK